MSVLSFSAESALDGFGALRVAAPSGPAPGEGWRKTRASVMSLSALGGLDKRNDEGHKDSQSPKAAIARLPDVQAPNAAEQPRALGAALPEISAMSPRRRSCPGIVLGASVDKPVAPPPAVIQSPTAQSPRAQPVGVALPPVQMQPASPSLVHMNARSRWNVVANHFGGAVKAIRSKRMRVQESFGGQTAQHFLLPSPAAQQRPVNQFLRLGDQVQIEQNKAPAPGAVQGDSHAQSGFRMGGFRSRGWNFIKLALEKQAQQKRAAMQEVGQPVYNFVQAEHANTSSSALVGSKSIAAASKSCTNLLDELTKIRSEGLGCAGTENEQYAKDLPVGMEKLAATLVNRFGSLDRAFAAFDYNHQSRVTRGQWETTLATIKLDLAEVCGMPAKKVFRAIDTLDGGASKLEITLDQWLRFFKQHLEGTASEFLVKEDRGSQAPKRWAQMKNLNLKALAFLASGEPLPNGTSPVRSESHASPQNSRTFARTSSSSPKNLEGWRKTGTGGSGTTLDMPDDFGEGVDSREFESMLASEGAERRRKRFSASAPNGSVSFGRQSSFGSTDDSDSDSDSDTGSDDGGYMQVPKRLRKLSNASQSSQASFGAQMDPSSPGLAETNGKEVDQTRIDNEKLMKIISGKATDKELAEMTEAELRALAEQQQLEQEIYELELKHIEALAYVLVAKLKSLSRAFRYFDYMRKKKISNVVWGTGIALLHIDTEKLTGWKPGQIFFRIDQNPADGLITKRKWKEFFKDVNLPDEAKEKSKESLKHRAKQNFQKLHRRASLFRGDKGKRKAVDRSRLNADFIGDDEEDQERLKEEETDLFREKVQKRLKAIGEGESLTWNEAMLRGPAESMLSPWERAQIVRSLAEELGLWTLMGQNVASEEEPAHGLAGARTLAVKTSAPEPGAILICNLKKFAEETEDKLDSMEEGNSIEFPSELTDVQRAVVHILGAKHGLTTISEGKGAERRVIAHAASDFAYDLRSLFGELKVGESKRLSSDLSPVQRRLVHLIAADMGLTVTATKGNNGQLVLEVANMSDFLFTVTDELAQLEVGQNKVFDATAMTDREKQVIHDVAGQLGLVTKAEERGRRSHLMVTNELDPILQSAEEKMQQLGRIGSSGSFRLPCNAKQRQAFWSMADDMGFDASLPFGKSRDKIGADEIVKLRKAHAGKDGVTLHGPDGYLPFMPSLHSASSGQAKVNPGGEACGEKARGASHCLGATDADSSRAVLVNKAFEIYATGNKGGTKIFLRFVDLKEFVEDLRSVLPKSHPQFGKFSMLLEMCFDDTLQLQVDLGIRAGPGLTLAFFKVFVEKAMRRLGLQIASVLLAILDDQV